MELENAVWEFLPSRPDRRRVTHPDVIAANIGADPKLVVEALANLEAAGLIVRDGKTGTREGWHRFTAAEEVPADEPGLFGDVA